MWPLIDGIKSVATTSSEQISPLALQTLCEHAAGNLDELSADDLVELCIPVFPPLVSPRHATKMLAQFGPELALTSPFLRLASATLCRLNWTASGLPTW
jgi:hypothetical protein